MGQDFPRIVEGYDKASAMLVSTEVLPGSYILFNLPTGPGKLSHMEIYHYLGPVSDYDNTNLEIVIDGSTYCNQFLRDYVGGSLSYQILKNKVANVPLSTSKTSTEIVFDIPYKNSGSVKLTNQGENAIYLAVVLVCYTGS